MTTVIKKPSDDSLKELRRRSHPNCVVCGGANGHGLGLSFRTEGNGTVVGTFGCERVFEGYPDVLHGGVICALLDGAMTNCMFAHGYAAVTADLNVRFREPVSTSGWATVRAWVESSLQPLYNLAAELIQDGEIKVTANAKFVERVAAAKLMKGKVRR